MASAFRTVASSPLRAVPIFTAILMVAGCAAPAADPLASAATCPSWTARDYAEARVVRKLRIYTDPATGDSAIEESVLTPRTIPLFKTGQRLVQYDFGPGSKTQIVYGPARFEIPPHPAPYRESFLILQGSVTLTLGDGTSRLLLPGDMTTYEDTDARRGHGGTTGPCGFVGLNIVP